MKLPTLYLIDSICKNIGEPYISVFATLLPSAFLTSFRQLRDERTRHEFGRTLETWWGLFPDGLVRDIQRHSFGEQSSLGRRQLPEAVLAEPPARRPVPNQFGPRPPLIPVPPPGTFLRLLQDLRAAMTVPAERYNEKYVAEIMYHVGLLWV